MDQGKGEASGNRPENEPTFVDAKKHYEELVSYFKWLVTITLAAIGIISTVGLSLFYRDMGQARQEVRANIEEQRKSVDREMSKIREDAAKVAVAEAQSRVEEAFKSENVRSMVESAARKQVGPAIERQLAAEVDRAMTDVQTEISALGEIADMGMKMRIGLRSGLEGLISKTKTARDENMRNTAKSLLQSIANDYEAVQIEYIRDKTFQTHLEAAQSFSALQIDQSRPVPSLVKIIRASRRLNEVSTAFLALREATGQAFRMFDIEAVERWCKGNEALCR